LIETIWIIGYGRFGKIAHKRLLSKAKNLLIVDPFPKGSINSSVAKVEMIKEDGIRYLKDHLRPEPPPDWIIPSLPLHLLAEWAIALLGDQKIKRIGVPSELSGLVPNPIKGADGNLYVSHATFLCPDDCPEPKDICTYTGKKRGKDMFKILEELEIHAFSVKVLRSLQLAPGVGGYRPKDMFHILDDIRRSPGRYLLCTSCRCHGVITAVATY